jgi:D-alanyl-D-alanine dipeptidase
MNFKRSQPIYFLLLSVLTFIFSCKSQNQISKSNSQNQPILNDTSLVHLKDYSKDFEYDLKYATSDNFLKAKVYDCPACFLRLKTVKALIEANKEFVKKGYKIKIFDCYRPLTIQKKMWELIPNPAYVADPSKGSIHNRGGAVDITLIDTKGKELDMGTPFDFFGIEASHNYSDVSLEVKQNRALLKNTMLKNGFKSFESEWWHYNLKTAINDKISDIKWHCD